MRGPLLLALIPSKITSIKTASLTEANVVTLYGLLGDGYERNAVWCMRKATFFTDFFPLMDKSKNNLIEFAGGKYYIMGAEVYFTGSVPASEAYLGDFSYISLGYGREVAPEDGDEHDEGLEELNQKKTPFGGRNTTA